MRTFTLIGSNSELTTVVDPPIIVEEDLIIGLLSFDVYNSTPNVNETNNKLYYGNDGKFITIPTGSYEIEQLELFLQEKLGKDVITLKANSATLQTKLLCKHIIDFQKPGSINQLLGFSPRLLTANIEHFSDNLVKITAVEKIIIECNLVKGAYINGKETHMIYSFVPSVPPGYKIVEIGRQDYYLPVNTRRIDRISIKVTDQDGRVLDFRGEILSVNIFIKYGRSI